MDLLVTIDVEPDDVWSRPRTSTFRNLLGLHRFHRLCESKGLIPTYLVEWETANRPELAWMIGTCEVGMHLHAWTCPPAHPLDDSQEQPFLTEYPEDVIRAKVNAMQTKITERFGRPAFVHRAGRWAMNDIYARALADAGVRVDCSVTPGYVWKQRTGLDYSLAPTTPYQLAPGIIEVPFLGIRPNGTNGWYLRRLLRGRRDWHMFMLHSSELMEGCSPTFRTEESIERLYGELHELFSGPGLKGCRFQDFVHSRSTHQMSGPG